MFHHCRWSVCFLALFFAPISFSTISFAQDEVPEAVFSGHLDGVTMGMFTPDGTAVLTSSVDQTARLWDLATRAQQRKYAQHTGPILSMAVSGDGATLVTGGQDNTLRVWDLPLGRPINVFKGHQEPVNALTLSPVGDTLVTASGDQTIVARSSTDSTDKGTSKSGHLTKVLAVAYRNDGAYFASSDSSGRILIWSPYLEQPQGDLHSHDGAVTALQFTADNQHLFSAGDDGVVRTWQLNPNVPKRFELGEAPVVAWAVNSGRSQAVCLAEDGKALVLNLSDGAIVSELPKFDFVPSSIAQAPDSSWICVGDDAGTAHVLNWDGTVRAVVKAHSGRVNDVVIHPDSLRFATAGSDGVVKIWGQPTAGETPQQPLHAFHLDPDSSSSATALAFSADQQHLWCGAEDGSIHQWHVATGKLVRAIDAHTAPDVKVIRRLVITRDSQFILTIGEDQSLRCFKSSDGSAVQVMPHPVPIRDVAIAPDNTRAAVACDDGRVRLWDLRSGTLLQVLSGHKAAVQAVAYLNDGQTIATVSRDKSLRLTKTSIVRAAQVHQDAICGLTMDARGANLVTCDQRHIMMTQAATGAEVRPYRVKEAAADETQSQSDEQDKYRKLELTTVVMRPDNQRIAAGTAANEVIVWNSSNAESLWQTLELDSRPIALAYSVDNRKLAVATEADVVHIFGPSEPGVQPPVELTLHQQIKTNAALSDVAFAQDGQSVFVGLSDGTTEQWRYAETAQQRQMIHGGPIYGLAITNDGKTAVSCSADQTIRVWDTRTGRQTAQMRGHIGAVLAIAISSDETFVVTSGADGTVRLWDVVGGRQLKQLAKFDDNIYSIDIHPNGQTVAVAGADQKVHLLDMTTGEEKQTLEGHPDYIHCISFDQAGQRLLSYGYAGHLKIWDTSDGKLLKEIRIGKVGNYAQFSPDGKQIMLSNGDGTARVIPAP